MKKQFALIVAVLLSISANSQYNRDVRNYIQSLENSPLRRQLRKDSPEIQGSPYINKLFSLAKVQNVVNNSLMRYDACYDEFEFINSTKDTLVLNKEESFNNITFVATNTTYQLVNYTNNKGDLTMGYLIWLYENKGYILFKKETIIYTKERIAQSNYQTSSPAKYERVKDVFYLKNEDKGILEFPTNKKGLLKLFPEKKTALEAFIKQNNIDFDKQPDLVKIIDFLTI